MALYRINHPATGRVVNLYISSSTGSVPHGTPLSLYPWQNNSDQKFEMEYRGDYVIFRLQRDTSQVINRNASNNQAMVWPFSTDQATLNDSLINTETEGGNMRIKLVHQGLYLTKDSSSNMLYWQPKATTDRQYFTLQQVDGSGSTGGETSDTCLPCKYTDYGYRYGELDHEGDIHYAIDLSNALGTPIYAWCDGVIARKMSPNGSSNDSLGNCLFLHSNNPNKAINGSKYVRAIYAHLNAFANGIAENVSVKAGQCIGYMGQTGEAFGVHLHFAMQCSDKYVLNNSFAGNRYEHDNWINPASYLPGLNYLNP